MTPQAFVRPKPLQVGSVVRLVRPAGAYAPQALEEGIALLRAHGLVPRLSKQWPYQDRAPSPYYAASTQARAEELRAALNDDEAQALWAVRGGSGTAALLPHVTLALQARLSRRPPWLVGFSDITTLLCHWSARQIMAVHGANMTNLAPWHADARHELMQLLMGSPEVSSHHACRPLLSAWPEGLAVPKAGVTGTLVGGNLTVLASLCGTGALPSWRGCVVFLEDIAERPYRLDRCLQQLVASGAFAGAEAIIFGQLTQCEAEDGGGNPYGALDLVAPTLRELGVPVGYGLVVGHEACSRPLLLGGRACWQVAQGQLHIDGAGR